MTTEEWQRVNILSAQGLTPNAIGLEIGRDRKTVLSHLQKPESQVQVFDIRERLGLKYLELAEKVINRVTDETIDKSSLQQIAVISGILFVKFRLATGQSTQNTAVIMASAIMEFEADRNRERTEIG
jgi:hypothetical protein